jgi:hypothetical protein
VSLFRRIQKSALSKITVREMTEQAMRGYITIPPFWNSSNIMNQAPLLLVKIIQKAIDSARYQYKPSKSNNPTKVRTR